MCEGAPPVAMSARTLHDTTNEFPDGLVRVRGRCELVSIDRKARLLRNRLPQRPFECLRSPDLGGDLPSCVGVLLCIELRRRQCAVTEYGLSRLQAELTANARSGAVPQPMWVPAVLAPPCGQ